MLSQLEYWTFKFISNIVSVFFVVTVLGLLRFVLTIEVYKGEPPLVQPRVPVFGHVMGMLTQGPLYLKAVSQKCKLPIFTLHMAFGRTYIITCPDLTSAAQRAASTIDFDPLVIAIIPRLCGCSSRTKSILEDLHAQEEGRLPFVKRSHLLVNPQLAAHKTKNLSQIQLGHFSNYLAVANVGFGGEIELFKFITRIFTVSSMYTFYGPNNPFAANPCLIEKYWDWESNNIGYAMGIFPKLTARKAYIGAEACIQGFIQYAKERHYSEASSLMQSKKRMHDEEGITLEENARLELGISFAIISNGGITAFWVLNNIFSRPELLRQIREEILQNAFEAPGTIIVPKLNECSLLNSVFRESIRLTTPMTSARMVLEDTVLDNKYLLRKGNIVQLVGGAMHADTAIWGPNAELFNPNRFIYTTKGSKTDMSGIVSSKKTDTVHAAAFRGFGGGTNLCPGRHFAQIEVLATTAALVMGFDMHLSNASQWDPPLDIKKFSLALIKPSKEVKVRLCRRVAFEQIKWQFEC